MTNQATENFHYENEDYTLFAFGNENIMSHEAFGVKARVESTNLVRGFISTYAVKDNKLVVKDLRFYGEVEQAVGKTLPIYDRDKERTIYKDLNIVLPYTGYVFFGNDAAGAAYWGSSHKEAIKAYELSVFDGEIFETMDFSEKMAAKLEELSPLAKAEHDNSIELEDIIQQMWDRISQFLPRKYRFIYATSYMDFEWAIKPKTWSRKKS